MSEHLPECWSTDPAFCICDRLRAAEQRGYDKAREAVAAVREPYLHPQYDEAIDEALAAIDALAERQVSPSDLDRRQSCSED